jgi:hypothetical protein
MRALPYFTWCHSNWHANQPFTPSSVSSTTNKLTVRTGVLLCFVQLRDGNSAQQTISQGQQK